MQVEWVGRVTSLEKVSAGRSAKRWSRARDMMMPPCEWTIITIFVTVGSIRQALTYSYATRASMVLYNRHRWIRHSIRSPGSPYLFLSQLCSIFE